VQSGGGGGGGGGKFRDDVVDDVLLLRSALTEGTPQRGRGAAASALTRALSHPQQAVALG
jgi:hypothetical protein